MKKELLNKVELPEGMYKVINYINNQIYKVEGLGLIKLKEWDGDQFLSVSKIDSNYNEIQDLNIILKPGYWIKLDDKIHESDEPIYFYCK